MPRALLFTALLFAGSAQAQQYGWVDLFGNMPDTPYDTVYIDGAPYYGSYTDLYFINEHEGWVTSSLPNEEQQFLIFHTTDGGTSWEMQQHWEYSHAIWMLDPENGYLGDHSGFIMRTEDGGETWQYHGATGAPVTDISFAPGSDTGYVTTDESIYLWRITPSGVDQIPIGGLNYWSGISATDEDAWFCGGNQVNRWDLDQQAIVPEPGAIHCGYFGPIHFVDKDHGWTGNDCHVRGFDDYDEFWPVLLETEGDAVTNLFAADTNHLWATTFNGRIYHTANASDYGYNQETNFYWSNVAWVEQPHPKQGNGVWAIQFTSPSAGYACGENNTIMKYTLITSTGEGPTEKPLHVQPNPTEGAVRISGLPDGPWQLSVLDLLGREVHRAAGAAGGGLLATDIGHLEPGEYLLCIVVGQRQFIQRVIKT